MADLNDFIIDWQQSQWELVQEHARDCPHKICNDCGEVFDADVSDCDCRGEDK